MHILLFNKNPDPGHTKRLRNKVWLGPGLEIAPLYINQRNMLAQKKTCRLLNTKRREPLQHLPLTADFM